MSDGVDFPWGRILQNGPHSFISILALLIRLVRMTFNPEALEAFLALFDASAPQSRAFSGCIHLELWTDARYPNLLNAIGQLRDAVY